MIGIEWEIAQKSSGRLRNRLEVYAIGAPQDSRRRQLGPIPHDRAVDPERVQRVSPVGFDKRAHAAKTDVIREFLLWLRGKQRGSAARIIEVQWRLKHPLPVIAARRPAPDFGLNREIGAIGL